MGARGLGVLKEPPKNLYYLRKKLLEYRLITKQVCTAAACPPGAQHPTRLFRNRYGNGTDNLTKTVGSIFRSEL